MSVAVWLAYIMYFMISRTSITQQVFFSLYFDGVVCKILKQVGQICVCLSITETKLRWAQYWKSGPTKTQML